MEGCITFITGNKVLLTIAVILSIMILFSFVKKLIKVALVLLAIFILYCGYLVYTGQKVPKTKKEIIDHGAKKLEVIKKTGQEKFNRTLR